MDDTAETFNPIQIRNEPVTIQAIENGYLVSRYGQGGYLQWYCIDEHEVHEKLRKFLF